MARDIEGRRNKRKEKFRERKKHPYKSGGKYRTGDIDLKESQKRKKGKN